VATDHWALGSLLQLRYPGLALLGNETANQADQMPIILHLQSAFRGSLFNIWAILATHILIAGPDNKHARSQKKEKP
tara:strand:- start:14982 stop:15212 length:231 start_codon:yes stop_codon:yes gene_type:complete